MFLVKLLYYSMVIKSPGKVLKFLAKIKLKEMESDLLLVFRLHQLELLFLPDFSL